VISSNRPVRRRESVPATRVAAGGLVVLLLVGIFVVLAVRAPREVPLLGYKTFFVDLDNTGNMRIHSEVRTEGVRIGEVTQVEPANGRARLRLKVDPGAAEIPKGTVAEVRGKGLLGARYVDLTFGKGPDLLPEGAAIPQGENPLTQSVSDVLQTFDEETRGGLRSSLANLGTGLLGRGDELNDTIRVAPPANTKVVGTVEAILAREGAARRLAPSLAAGAATFDDASDELVALLRPAQQALQVFVDEREATRSTIDAAAPALADLRSGADSTRPLLQATRTLSRAVNKSLPKAPTGLAAATRLLDMSPPALRSGRQLLDRAQPAVRPLIAVGNALRPELDPIKRLVTEAQPITDKLAAYKCDVIEFGDNWRSTLMQAVPGGGKIGPLTAFRVAPLIGPESLAGFDVGRNVVKTGQDAYPAPCRYKAHTWPVDLGSSR
jgi:phospholipid/cholesterol/gamma-HCH transport system substrate-binding protein